MLDKNGGIKMKKDLKRGEIYWAKLPDPKGTSQQTGFRPVLIMSNNRANKYSSMIHVIPLTTSLKKLDMPTHVQLVNTKLEKPTMALIESMNLVDKSIIIRKVTDIHPIDMINIKEALDVQFGDLDSEYEKLPKCI